MKSRLNKKENSVKGWQGVLKKLGYWTMIMIAFAASVLFIKIESTLGITTLLGWFVLASLAINEIRSIVENLVEAGYNIPNVLTKGLEVADYFNKSVDKTDKKQITKDNVYIVWCCKTLQNTKVLASTNVSDGMYYELTYKGDKNELYFDAYKKWENKCIKLGGKLI